MDTVRNVFLLSVDSLSYRAYSEYFEKLPRIIDGATFEQAISPASNTNSAMPTIAAGVYADRLTKVGLPEAGSPTPLAECLEEIGYECGQWTDNYLCGSTHNYDRGFVGGNKGQPTPTRRVASLLQGHDRLYNLAKWGYFNLLSPIVSIIQSDTTVWRRAETLHTGALSWLSDSASEPTFAWLHYMDTHHPYMPPEEYIDKGSFHKQRSQSKLGKITREVVYSDGESASDDELEDVQEAYRLCCKYLDDEVTSFISILKERDFYDPDKDVIIFTADHGESFRPNIHNRMGHKGFWEEVIRVPLEIQHPDWGTETINNQVSLIDVVPTLIEQAGGSCPATMVGTPRKSPRDFVRNTVYLTDAQPWFRTMRGIRKEGKKLFGYMESHEDSEYGIVASTYSNKNHSEEIIYYQLEDELSPRVDSIDPDTVSELRNDLINNRGVLLEESSEFTIDEQLEEQLKKLGYMN